MPRYMLVIPELMGTSGIKRVEVSGSIPIETVREHSGIEWVERVSVSLSTVAGLDLLLDEEAIFKASPQPNTRAMALAWAARGPLRQHLVGNAVVVKGNDAGNWVGLTEQEAVTVEAAIKSKVGTVEAWSGAQSARRGRR